MKTTAEYRASIDRKAAARKGRNRLLGTLIPAAGCAAVCCAALLLAGPAQGISLPAAGDSSAAHTAQTGGVPSSGTAAPPEFCFAGVDSKGAGKPYFDPDTTYRETWTAAEAEAYIGRSLTPHYLLPGLSRAGSGGATVVRNNDGSLACDIVVESYRSQTEGYDPLQKTFTVRATRLFTTPGYLIGWPEGDQGQTVLGETAIRLGHQTVAYYNGGEEPAGYTNRYVAEFSVGGAQFQVVSNNLSQREFLAMALSLLDEGDLSAAGIDIAELAYLGCA